jgi:hypothetical protein
VPAPAVDWAGVGVGVGDEVADGLGVGRAACACLLTSRARAAWEGAADGVGECSGLVAARALSTAALVSCWLELPLTPNPAPRSETAIRQPPVAVTAPSSQALTAMRILGRTNVRLARPTLRRGKARLNGRTASPPGHFTRSTRFGSVCLTSQDPITSVSWRSYCS